MDEMELDYPNLRAASDWVGPLRNHVKPGCTDEVRYERWFIHREQLNGRPTWVVSQSYVGPQGSQPVAVFDAVMDHRTSHEEAANGIVKWAYSNLGPP